jgi:hypothetical protein
MRSLIKAPWILDKATWILDEERFSCGAGFHAEAANAA